MILPRKSYEVIGEHSAPADFEHYALTLRAQRKRVHITAKQIGIDELAARRSNHIDQISYEFLMTELHSIDEGFVFGGYLFTNGTKGKWVLIEGTDRVRFDVID